MASASLSTAAARRSRSPSDSGDLNDFKWPADSWTDCEVARALENAQRGRPVFEVVRVSTADLEMEERYNRKDKSLSQLSKRFLAEFGLASNQVISMFEVTDKLSTIDSCRSRKAPRLRHHQHPGKPRRGLAQRQELLLLEEPRRHRRENKRTGKR